MPVQLQLLLEQKMAAQSRIWLLRFSLLYLHACIRKFLLAAAGLCVVSISFFGLCVSVWLPACLSHVFPTRSPWRSHGTKIWPPAENPPT